MLWVLVNLAKKRSRGTLMCRHHSIVCTEIFHFQKSFRCHDFFLSYYHHHLHHHHHHHRHRIYLRNTEASSGSCSPRRSRCSGFRWWRRFPRLAEPSVIGKIRIMVKMVLVIMMMIVLMKEREILWKWDGNEKQILQRHVMQDRLDIFLPFGWFDLKKSRSRKRLSQEILYKELVPLILILHSVFALVQFV